MAKLLASRRVLGRGQRRPRHPRRQRVRRRVRHRAQVPRDPPVQGRAGQTTSSWPSSRSRARPPAVAEDEDRSRRRGRDGLRLCGHPRRRGNDVWAVDLWAEHVEAIRRDGLTVDGASGSRTVRIGATSDPAEVGACDLVVIATKAMHVEAAAAAAVPLLGPDTARAAAPERPRQPRPGRRRSSARSASRSASWAGSAPRSSPRGTSTTRAGSCCDSASAAGRRRRGSARSRRSGRMRASGSRSTTTSSSSSGRS